jgi:Zn-dependent protease with chaperone function
MQAALSLRNRKTEQQADFFTAELGYGEDMVKALYLLEKMSLSGEALVVDGLVASHPRVTARIEALEIKLGLQEEWLCDKEVMIG